MVAEILFGDLLTIFKIKLSEKTLKVFLPDRPCHSELHEDKAQKPENTRMGEKVCIMMRKERKNSID